MNREIDVPSPWYPPTPSVKDGRGSRVLIPALIKVFLNPIAGVRSYAMISPDQFPGKDQRFQATARVLYKGVARTREEVTLRRGGSPKWPNDLSLYRPLRETGQEEGNQLYS